MTNRFFEELITRCEREELNITGGHCKALWAYRKSRDSNLDVFCMDDFLWEREIGDFADILKEAGITKFALSNTSTALMDNIIGLAKEGYEIKGYTRLEKQGTWETEKINALVFRLV